MPIGDLGPRPGASRLRSDMSCRPDLSSWQTAVGRANRLRAPPEWNCRAHSVGHAAHGNFTRSLAAGYGKMRGWRSPAPKAFIQPGLNRWAISMTWGIVVTGRDMASGQGQTPPSGKGLAPRFRFHGGDSNGALDPITFMNPGKIPTRRRVRRDKASAQVAKLRPALGRRDASRALGFYSFWKRRPCARVFKRLSHLSSLGRAWVLYRFAARAD